MLTAEDTANFEGLIRALKGHHNVSILVGAGVSISSGVPSSLGIVRILKRLGRINRYAPYSTAMQMAFENSRQRRAFLERLFLGRPPSQEHYSLAHLVGKQVFKNVFTTNFDHLTEIALSQVCNCVVRSYLTREGLESIDERTRVARVIKLHGDFLFSSLANTDEEMGRAVTDLMRSKFTDLLKRGGLVVLGYAGDSSILEVLKELSEIPEILNQGLWWVSHCPSTAEQEASQDVIHISANVGQFMSAMQSAGKTATVIKNSFGAAWLLNEICQRVTGESPVKPKFGIGFTKVLAPQVGWKAEPPPLPPGDPFIDKALDELKSKLTTPSVTLLEGASDGQKTALVATLISETSQRPCFYFSFAFARNNPEDLSFLGALGDFLDSKGLLAEESGRQFWVEVLLSHDGIIVLDDLPISLDKSRRNVEVGTCRNSFVKVFYPALMVLRKLSRGNLIVCLPDSMPAKWKGDFLNVQSIAPDVRVMEMHLPEMSHKETSIHSFLKILNSTSSSSASAEKAS